MPCQQASLLAWLREHERKVYDTIRWAFSVTDYIRFRLTGEAFSEATNISGSGLMNLRDARIDPDLLAALGTPEAFDMIPPVRYSSERRRPVTGTPIAMNSLYAIPGFFLIEESSSTGAGNLDWVIRRFFPHETPPEGKALYPHLDELAAGVPAEGSEVYFLPFLHGSNRPPLAKACFLGLTSFHTPAHLLRSVYEGVVYSAKTHIDKLLTVREPPQTVRMAGGAARSPFWVQLFADILELPIETVTGVKELGALAAAVAAGIHTDYPEAASAMVRIAPPV